MTPLSIPILEQFCDDLIAQAVASVREEFPAAELPAFDWRRLWASDPANSPEKAAGHAVVVAQQIATEMLRSKQSIAGVRTPQQASSPPPPPTPTGARVGAPAPPPAPDPLPAPTETPKETAPPSQSTVVEVQESPAPTFLVATTTTGEDESEPRSERTAQTTEQLRRRSRRLRRIFVAFGWVRDFGLILLAFAAWQVWGTSIEQSQSQHALREQFQSHVQSNVPQTSLEPNGPALTSANIRVPGPPEGSVVGHLQIPAIGVDQYVVEGTGEADLAKGPGHYIGTSMPGQAGNIAIAGHRTTFGAPFNSLDHLKAGDQILLTSDAGEQLTYVVAGSPFAVSPGDVSVLNTVTDNRLTLTTCNPKFSATQRLVVVALLSQPETVAATPVVKPRTISVVAEPIGWNTRYVLPVLLLVALLIALGLASRKARAVYGRIGRWLILTPIWVAAIFFLFESLTRLLPANL